MFRLISLKLWITIVVYLALAGGPVAAWAVDGLAKLSPWVALWLSSLISSQTLVLAVWVVIGLALYKPVWRFFWRLPVVGKWLSSAVFPDLNGSWNVEIESNWPIIDAIRKAAKDGGPRFDVLSESARLPEFQRLHFCATIDQGWFSTKVTLVSDGQSILKSSNTLFVQLLPASDMEEKRIAMTFKQQNSPPRVATDQQEFFGSAILVVSEHGQSMEGQYWNNRSWDRGLNAAGVVRMRRGTY